MRGRTLNDSFIILDEAQNTSAEQMKMFLTRLGFGSRIVVTGDVTQVDLPSGTQSGLRLVQDILEGVDDVYFSRLTSHDVVRHKLVADIVDAYERYDAARRRPAARISGSPAAGRAGPAAAGTGDRVSIEIANESGAEVDEADLAALARHVLDDMGVHPLAELSVLLVDDADHDRAARALDGRAGPDRRAGLPHGRAAAAAPGRGAHRPRAGRRARAAARAARRRGALPAGGRGPGRRGRSRPDRRARAAHRHGILHLLGYDHADPDEHAAMFGLQDKLLAQWRSLRPAPPAGAPGSPAGSHPPGAAGRPEGPG